MNMPVDGNWKITVQTPLGPQDSTVTLTSDGSKLTGTAEASNGGSAELEDGEIDGDNFSWNAKINKPMPLTIEFSGTLDGDTMSGNVKFGIMGSGSFSGARI
jgi:hypothetical protein